MLMRLFGTLYISVLYVANYVGKWDTKRWQTYHILWCRYVWTLIIKERRSKLKRYGTLFTYFSSRAVHIELTNSSDADSFILALLRFMARRRTVRSIWSDNGTNFVGAKNELQRAFKEMKHDKIKSFLQENGADWILWHNNPPGASHMGGVWERQIQSARTILEGLLKTHSHSLNDESLRILMAEI